MDSETRQRIEDLEYRLYQYHERLSESIEQRDRLAIDAAWGVHYALFSSLALISVFYAYIRYFRTSGWLGDAALVLAIVVVPMIVHMWSNGARMKEVDTFAKLPEWEWKHD